MSEKLKRIKALEDRLPRPIILVLDDGTEFRYSKGTLKLYNEFVAQVYEGRGPLPEIMRRAVSSSGFGPRMLELCRALLAPYKPPRRI